MGCCSSNYRLSAQDHLKGMDLSSRTFIITGATTGLGLETAKALAAAKARVVILGRDQKKIEQVALNIAGITKDWVIPMVCDLASQDSVRSFAENFRKLNLPIHGLILNAGVMATGYRLTKEGIDIQFGTNHVGHFLLTMLLVDILISSAPSRVISVSSGAHQSFGGPRIEFANLPKVDEKDYRKFIAYQQSKLANILFAAEFSERYKDKGVTAYSLHPGVIATELGEEIGGFGLFTCCCSPCLKSVSQGAATQVYCAVAKNIEEYSGHYFQDSQVTEPHPSAKNVDDRKKLWAWTEQITGLKNQEQKEQKE